MKKEEFNKLKHGLYKVTWADGGESLGAVGSNEKGERWLAPTNWVTIDQDMANIHGIWDRIESMRQLKTPALKRAPITAQSTVNDIVAELEEDNASLEHEDESVYKTKVVQINVYKEGDNPIFGESVTEVCIATEGGGEFIKLKQSPDNVQLGEVAFNDLDEMMMVIDTVKKLEIDDEG
jgi:hypothetical protein